MGLTSPGRSPSQRLVAAGNLSPRVFRSRTSAEGRRGRQDTGRFEKLIVASGARRPRARSRSGSAAGRPRPGREPTVLRFDLERDSFLTVLVFNGELRGPLPGSVRLIPQDSAALPRSLSASRTSSWSSRPPGARRSTSSSATRRPASPSSTSKGMSSPTSPGPRAQRSSGTPADLEGIRRRARASVRRRVRRRDHLDRRDHAPDRGHAGRRRRDPGGRALPGLEIAGRRAGAGRHRRRRERPGAVRRHQTERRSASPWAPTRATPAS